MTSKVKALLKSGTDADRGQTPYLDLIGESDHSAQALGKLFQLPVIATIYEQWWRPALGRVAKGAFGPSMEDEEAIAHLLLALGRGDKVLDVACGTGRFTREFAEIVGSEGLSVGLDPSAAMLERAVTQTSKTGKVKPVYVRANAEALPFKDASFNAVCCFAALHLFADPFRSMDEICRVLAPGGRVALFISLRSRTGVFASVEGALVGGSGVYLFSEEEIRDALLERGFVDLRQKVAGVTQFVGARKPR